jgi:hypothetical protein
VGDCEVVEAERAFVERGDAVARLGLRDRLNVASRRGVALVFVVGLVDAAAVGQRVQFVWD